MTYEAFTYYEIIFIKSQVELCSQGPQHFVRDIGHDSLVFPEDTIIITFAMLCYESNVIDNAMHQR